MTRKLHNHRSGVCLGSFSEILADLLVTGSRVIQIAHHFWADCKPKDNLAGFCQSAVTLRVGAITASSARVFSASHIAPATMTIKMHRATLIILVMATVTPNQNE
jgi:hypothetical protein